LMQFASKEATHVIGIKPESLALNYISNSNILDFVLQLGVSLDIFFRLLWRHVFVVEVLRFRSRNSQISLNCFEMFLNRRKRDITSSSIGLMKIGSPISYVIC